MRFLLPFLLVSFQVTKAQTVVPAPINVGPSQSWYANVNINTICVAILTAHRDGDDGEWSTFPIRVGTPAQNVRVLISTAATNTWVIADPIGCDGFQKPDCADTRGALFAANESSTWSDVGVLGLHIEENLGDNDQGDFGFDTGESP